MSFRTILVRKKHLKQYLNKKNKHFQATLSVLEKALQNIRPKTVPFGKNGEPHLLLRDFIPGHFYHLTHHVAPEKMLIKDEEELKLAKTSLDLFAGKYGVRIINFIFMNNHLHLLVVPKPGSDVSRFMQAFLSSAVQKINHKRGIEARKAGLQDLPESDSLNFKGRFIAVLLLDPYYLVATTLYIFLNAEKAGFKDSVGQQARHNWKTFSKEFKSLTIQAPNGLPLSRMLAGLVRKYQKQRKLLLQQYQTGRKQRPHKKQRRRPSFQDVFDQLLEDVEFLIPPWARKRRDFDALRETW